MNLILVDDPEIRTNLLPLTFVRPTSEIRIGILTIAEKWGKYTSMVPSYLTESYLGLKFSIKTGEKNLLINSAVCPTSELIASVRNLKPGQALVNNGKFIAGVVHGNQELNYPFQYLWQKEAEFPLELTIVDRLWKIFTENDNQLRTDFELLTKGRDSIKISDPHTVVYGEENVFVEEGVSIKATVINAETGPVYLGKNVLIQEGAIIRGPTAVCEGSHINMNAKIRPATTIGPFSRAGGEINNVVIFGNSNKGHEGFLGNAVIGEWCNIGADSNNSNLKNNYADIRLWDYSSQGFINTGLQFCGLIMGDHSKCGINTMFNTGTVVGIGANIFGSGFPKSFIPSFSWGGPAGFTTYKLPKFLEVVERVMKRRNLNLGDDDRNILSHIFEVSQKYRNY